MRPADADVDHFLPWSRSPLNAVENLVVADRRANRDKSDHLAAVEHVMCWRARNRYHADDLQHIAHSNRWETTPIQTLGVARALYLVLGPANRLWSASNVFVPADVVAIRSLLAA